MKANEFIKKYGLKKAKELYNSDDWSTVSEIFLHDLRVLIESHDRVMEHGSINRAKKYAESKYTAPEIKSMLLQDITNVESCQ